MQLFQHLTASISIHFGEFSGRPTIQEKSTSFPHLCIIIELGRWKYKCLLCLRNKYNNSSQFPVNQNTLTFEFWVLSYLAEHKYWEISQGHQLLLNKPQSDSLNSEFSAVYCRGFAIVVSFINPPQERSLS